MISDNLNAVAAKFCGYAVSGPMVMQPEALRTIATILYAIGEQVAELERSRIPINAQLPTSRLPDNVVAFRPRRPRDITAPAGDGAA